MCSDVDDVLCPRTRKPKERGTEGFITTRRIQRSVSRGCVENKVAPERLNYGELLHSSKHNSTDFPSHCGGRVPPPEHQLGQCTWVGAPVIRCHTLSETESSNCSLMHSLTAPENAMIYRGHLMSRRSRK